MDCCLRHNFQSKEASNFKQGLITLRRGRGMRHLCDSSSSLLVMYLSAIETVTCHTEIEVDRVYSLWFCTKYDT